MDDTEETEGESGQPPVILKTNGVPPLLSIVTYISQVGSGNTLAVIGPSIVVEICQQSVTCQLDL